MLPMYLQTAQNSKLKTQKKIIENPKEKKKLKREWDLKKKTIKESRNGLIQRLRNIRGSF